MKKLNLTLLCNIIFSLIVQAQCTFQKIFPVEHGISKFKATTTIASVKYIKEDIEANQFMGNFKSWKKFDYLKGDSVYKSSIFYDYLYQDCLRGDENELMLSFVDDKLYKIYITLNFSNKKFENFIENYNSLVLIFKDIFPDWEQFETKDDATKEQTGLGYWFYPTLKDKRDFVKLENLSIEQTVEYEMGHNADKTKYFRTSNVDKYVIEIIYMNLKGTKLTNEGF